MKKSKLDLFTAFAGKQTLSLGKSSGIRTNPLPLHDRENDEDGETEETNATSEANDAVTTTSVSISVHVAAWIRRGRRANRRKIEWREWKIMVIENCWLGGRRLIHVVVFSVEKKRNEGELMHVLVYYS